MAHDVERILVCGAGQGGHAIAAYAALQGHEVTLYSHTSSKVERLLEKGKRINLSGIVNDSAQLSRVTGDLSDAVQGNNVIIIVSDATVHQLYADRLSPYLSDQAILLISPGVGGALSFYNRLRINGVAGDVRVGETDTLMYACKVPEIGSSHIKEEKQSIIYTTIPDDSARLDALLERIYPQFRKHPSPLMGLDDSPVFHIVGMVRNAERILNKEDFNFYLDGITPEVAEVMERMDKERCAVARAAGIDPRPIRMWLNEVYGVPFGSLYRMIHDTPPYQDLAPGTIRSPAPKSLFHRYLFEEVPLRAVPTVEIGKLYGIDLPLYREMVDEASALTGVDFWKIGRTLEDMGLTEDDLYKS